MQSKLRRKRGRGRGESESIDSTCLFFQELQARGVTDLKTRQTSGLQGKQEDKPERQGGLVVTYLWPIKRSPCSSQVSSEKGKQVRRPVPWPAREFQVCKGVRHEESGPDCGRMACWEDNQDNLKDLRLEHFGDLGRG